MDTPAVIQLAFDNLHSKVKQDGDVMILTYQYRKKGDDIADTKFGYYVSNHTVHDIAAQNQYIRDNITADKD